MGGRCGHIEGWEGGVVTLRGGEGGVVALRGTRWEGIEVWLH